MFYVAKFQCFVEPEDGLFSYLKSENVYSEPKNGLLVIESLENLMLSLEMILLSLKMTLVTLKIEFLSL